MVQIKLGKTSTQSTHTTLTWATEITDSVFKLYYLQTFYSVK